MEPLSTFFRISPTLLGHAFRTPRSPTSSSFSSPSFADHQTGLKVYRDSPTSISSKHQVVDDNPLFEGFPVLPAGSREKLLAAGASRRSERHSAGGSPKLQEQLYHLLTILQQALEVHNNGGLPDGLAPQLADELEAVAKQLKEKERDAPVERQLRAKVQLALTGAEATIRKLRATPMRGTETSWGVHWRYNEATEAIPTCDSSSDSGSSDDGAVSVGTRRRNLKDSVCKQLLQSPSSSLSPLSSAVPAGVSGASLVTGDGASMASPKELPTDQQQFQQDPSPSICQQRASDADASGGTPAVCSVMAPGFQPPLYQWMKAALASPSKQDDESTQSGVFDNLSSADASGPQSPQGAGDDRDGLADAIRTALTSTATPPIVYGSPLHRRIQRLLAEQQSPSPLHHAAAQADDPNNTSQDTADGITERYQEPATICPRSTWARIAGTESLDASHRCTDSSSSCSTPTVQGDLPALPYHSSISPFGPTLRERYACKTSSVACASDAQPTATGVSPAINSPRCPGQPCQDHSEAAALVAQLGLDLQLDPSTADSISELEVLEHVERWAREQYTAAKRALLASKEPAAQVEDDRTQTGATLMDACFHAMVDIAIQTEQAANHQLTHRSDLSTQTRDVGTTVTPQPRSSDAAASTCSEQDQYPVAWRQGAQKATLEYSPLPDVRSPLRFDQVKRTPPTSLEASPIRDKPSCLDPALKGGTGHAAHGARRCLAHTEFGSPPVRRGLFQAAASPEVDSGRERDVCHDQRRATSTFGEGAADGKVYASDHVKTLTTAARNPARAGPLRGSLPIGQAHSDNRQASCQHMVEHFLTRELVPMSSITSNREGATANPTLHTSSAKTAHSGRVCAARPEVLLTPGSSIRGRGSTVTTMAAPSNSHASAHNGPAGKGSGWHTNALYSSSGDGSPSDQGTLRSQSTGPGVTPLTGSTMSKTSSRSGRRFPGPCPEVREDALEVAFTPGTAASSSGRTGRHKSRVFTDSVRSGSGSHNVGTSLSGAQTLSSISDVSIIASERVTRSGGRDSSAELSVVHGPLSQPGTSRDDRRCSFVFLHKSFVGCMASFLVCARGTSAT